MKVSIITISRNSEATIKETIDSVIHQDYPNIEYIVIDGKSEDGTVAIVQSYGNKITHFISEKDKGIYDAMNKGLKLATGAVIGFINADDMLYSNNTISEIVKSFQKHNADVVYGDNIFISPTNPDKVVRVWKAGEYNKENFREGWMSPHLATYIKKDLYDKYGYFNTDFKIASDYELMLRFMYKHEASAVYLPEIITKMRAGGLSNGSLKNIMIANLEVYKCWKINGLKVSPSIVFKKPFKKIKQLFLKKGIGS